MAIITGPISTLPGSHHSPKGACCDSHPNRIAVTRIQGETDSFGSEMVDLCQECLDEHNTYLQSEESKDSRRGSCDWCNRYVEDLRSARDYDEGMCGPVYTVCGPCVKARND